MLAPTLTPGDTVMMGPRKPLRGFADLPAHKVAGVRAAIQATGAQVRSVPPCRPDLNPIELAFAKLKALLRRAVARTIPALWTAIGDALPQFAPGKCANHSTVCGYEPE